MAQVYSLGSIRLCSIFPSSISIVASAGSAEPTCHVGGGIVFSMTSDDCEDSGPKLAETQVVAGAQDKSAQSASLLFQWEPHVASGFAFVVDV